MSDDRKMLYAFIVFCWLPTFVCFVYVVVSIAFPWNGDRDPGWVAK